jgi:hypothetical protein
MSNWAVALISEDNEVTVRSPVTEVDPKEIIYEMLTAGDAVINLCQEKGWESEDLNQLLTEVQAVRNLFNL